MAPPPAKPATLAKPETSLAPVAVGGSYLAVAELGAGDMTTAHLARVASGSGRQWAVVKRLHPHLAADDACVASFLEGAWIGRRAGHANVAQVFDASRDEGACWMAMEYLDGEPLAEVMRWALPPALAARIVADAADGLHAAHELRGDDGQPLGVVHCEVTPKRIVVMDAGHTKITGWTSAARAGRDPWCRPGSLRGRLEYMSPEQVRGHALDRTADVFSLGVVLWETATCRPLFLGDSPLDTLESLEACIVPPPSTLVPGYPAALDAIVMKALAKRPEDRFQTCRALSRALTGFLFGEGQFVSPEEVAAFVHAALADRIRERSARLRALQQRFA